MTKAQAASMTAWMDAVGRRFRGRMILRRRVADGAVEVEGIDDGDDGICDRGGKAGGGGSLRDSIQEAICDMMGVERVRRRERYLCGYGHTCR